VHEQESNSSTMHKLNGTVIRPDGELAAKTRSTIQIMNNTFACISITHLNHCRALLGLEELHLVTRTPPHN